MQGGWLRGASSPGLSLEARGLRWHGDQGHPLRPSATGCLAVRRPRRRWWPRGSASHVPGLRLQRRRGPPRLGVPCSPFHPDPWERRGAPTAGGRSPFAAPGRPARGRAFPAPGRPASHRAPPRPPTPPGHADPGPVPPSPEAWASAWPPPSLRRRPPLCPHPGPPASPRPRPGWTCRRVLGPTVATVSGAERRLRGPEARPLPARPPTGQKGRAGGSVPRGGGYPGPPPQEN